MSAETVTLRPKILALRGGLGAFGLVACLVGGAYWFFLRGDLWITGILAGASLGALGLLLAHLASVVEVDAQGVQLRSFLIRRRLSWPDIKVVEISEARASSPFMGTDIEKTLAVSDADGHSISVNLTMWHGFDDFARVVSQRRFGGTYELRGASDTGSGGSCSTGSCT